MSIYVIAKRKLSRALLMMGVAIVAYSCSMTPTAKIVVENTTDVDRQEEMVEVDLAAIKTELKLAGSENSFVVRDSKRQEIPSQVTYDGKLIFQASIAPSSNETFKISVGEPQEYPVKVYGRQFPERDDDFTWENDMNAVRISGPATQAAGLRIYGYDAWTKNTPKLVIEERYRKELNAEMRAQIAKLKAEGNTKEATRLQRSISYHVDQGDGMDDYNVGASLGAGCAALMERGNIIYPNCYTDYEILDEGPLRMTVKFTYAPFEVAGKDNVVETRIHQIDAGTCFTKSYVSYANLPKPMPIVAGIVMAGAKSKQAKVSKAEGYAVYADADRVRDLGAGTIFVGTIFPEEVKSAGVMPFVDNDADRKKMGLTGHVVLIGDYRPKNDFVYYWGSMWEKYKVNNFEDWVSYVADRSKMVKNPLVITIK